MRNTFFHRNVVGNERGVAALTVVLLGVVMVGIIALGFLARTEDKQYGASLTSTGNNAFMTAEAGLRYTEKCLLNNDPACPAVTANADWTNLTTGFTKTFGSGNGQFTISFAPIDSDNVVVTSVGTFRGATREVSKTLTKAVCKLTQNVITTCQNPNIHPLSTITGTVEQGYCPASPLVDPLTFPGNPAGCPNLSYPVFLNGVPPLAAPYQYCSWTHLLGNVTINGPATIWVANDFDMTGTSTLTINGDVTINVGGQMNIEDDAEIVVNGTLTLHSTGNFVMRNRAVLNTTGGDPADVLLLAESLVELRNDSVFVGGIISNGEFRLENKAVFTGAVLADDARTRKDTTATHAATAGSNSPQYNVCTP